MTATYRDLDLLAWVTSQTPEAIGLAYRVENRSSSSVYVFNQLYRRQSPEGVFEVDPNLVEVRLEEGRRVHVAKWVPEIPDGIFPEFPIVPCASLLPPGQRLEESFTLGLPVESHSLYEPVRPRLRSYQPATWPTLVFSLGYIKETDLGTRVPRTVTTTRGQAYYVPTMASGQQVVTAPPLPVSLPVVPDRPADVARRVCPACRAVNVGPQQECLRCGTALPPVPPPAARAAVPPTPPTPPAPVPTAPPVAPPTPAATRFCPSCGQTNPARNRFCSRCGTRLPP